MSVPPEFDVSDDELLTVDGEVWKDTPVYTFTDQSHSGHFQGSSLSRVAAFSFKDLSSYFSILEVELPGLKNDMRSWEFGSEVYLGSRDEPPTINFKLAFDVEFWTQRYGLADLAAAIEKVLTDVNGQLNFTQEDSHAS